MELTKKQIILIVVVSGTILLLTVAAILIFTPGEEEALPEPTAAPTQTPSWTTTPSPGPTPSPTVFQLPLVPQWDTPQPTEEPATGVFVPDEETPTETEGPWVDADDEQTRSILAVGLQDGRATALLLLRLDEDGLLVAALPTEEAPLAGDGPKEQGEEALSLVAARTGRRCGSYMALDLGCLPALLNVTGPLADQGEEALQGDGTERAEGALDLAAGALRYVQRVSLLKLPALKRAVGDCFGSNLSTWELWNLFWTIRSGVTVSARLLSGGRTSPIIEYLFGIRNEVKVLLKQIIFL